MWYITNQKERRQFRLNIIMKAKRIIKEIIPYVLVVLAVLFVNRVFFLNMHVTSGSMETTIMTKGRVFGNRLAYLTHDPERYDIVIFRPNEGEHSEFPYLKRIIGLPGDHIEIIDNVLYINGKKNKLRHNDC